MQNSKRFVLLLLCYFSVISLEVGLFNKVDIAQARPSRGEEKLDQKKPKRPNQGQQQQPSNQGQQGPPSQAPAWGRRCNRSEITNHPGNRECTKPEKQEDEITVSPDGTIVFPNGIIINPDGTIVNPDGTIGPRPGTIVLPDGRTILSDGTIVYPDGTRIDIEGTTTSPDGTVIQTETPASDLLGQQIKSLLGVTFEKRVLSVQLPQPKLFVHGDLNTTKSYLKFISENKNLSDSGFLVAQIQPSNPLVIRYLKTTTYIGNDNYYKNARVFEPPSVKLYTDFYVYFAIREIGLVLPYPTPRGLALLKILSDGTTVFARAFSTSTQGPTMEITPPGPRRALKVRILPAGKTLP